MSDTTTAHEVLVAGRNRLERGHLVKGEMTDDEGGYCAFGALFGGFGTFADKTSAEFGAGLALHKALGARSQEEGGKGDEVIEFNNRPETTKDDVLALFDRAIAATAPEPDPNLVTPEPVSA